MTTSRDDSDLSDNDSDLNVHVTVNSETKKSFASTTMYDSQKRSSNFSSSQCVKPSQQWDKNEIGGSGDGDLNVLGVVLDGVDPTPFKHKIAIQYERLTDSSYSEVTIRSLSNSLEQCFWDRSLSDPSIQDEGLDNFCPVDHGFTITEIRKGETCYLKRVFTPPCDSSEESSCRFFFPCYDNSSEDLIIHHPSEIWGYDENRLVLGVVTQFYEDPDVEYTWYNNGSIVNQGHHLCCIPIVECGTYTVEVRVGTKVEVSRAVKVELLKNAQAYGESRQKLVESDVDMKSPHSLPFVEKDQITFNKEINRGSFGVVFKGIWSGTEVAIKDIQVRNAKRLKSVMETEVQVHTMVRHPNITQIMAVSLEKNHIYIISEFVDGANLEDLLFGDDTQQKEAILSKTFYIAKQVTKAVAYLHNLNPSIVHRDIKPANILVAKDSCVTKLCDMGLSKLKSATMQAVTATGVPGTPHYMAPECIFLKKKSDLHSDIWSLACTLVELLTQKDCWESVLEELDSTDEASDNYEVNCMLSIFQRKLAPKSLELLVGANLTNVQQILADCFNYEPEERPRAIDIINVFLLK